MTWSEILAALREPMVVAGSLTVAALVVGLLRARAGAWPVRLAALFAAALLLASVIDPGVDSLASAQPRLRLVANGQVPAALQQVVSVGLGDALDLIEASADAGELAVAVRGAPVASPGAACALLWLQPIESGGAPASARVDAQAFTALEPLGFEPTAVQVRASGALRVGRPLSLELFGLPSTWRGEIEVTAPDATVLARASIDSTSAPVRARVEGLPTRAGAHRVTVRARDGARALSASGEIDVAAAPALFALGGGPDGPDGPEGESAAIAPLAAALLAQGFAVERAADLPADLARFEGVLLARRLTSDEQERVRAYVDDGGGVFLVGTEDGGALPIVGEPSAMLSPVILLARPTPRPSGDRGEGRQPDASPSPRQPSPDQPPPIAPLPDKPAVGDTSTDKPLAGPEKEVDRRVVAMVFVIDRSQSMLEPATPGGPTRMDFVRSSAQATASKLLPGDELAIVTFGNRDADEVVLPLTPATAFEQVHRAFAQLAARRFEGTYVDSAVARAALLLAESPAAVKHVVVITDGLIEDLIVALHRVKALRAAGVSVSMIRFGASEESVAATRLCRQFTEFGGGLYLHSTDTAEVPALVSAEVKRVLASTGRPVADEGQAAAAPALPTPTPPNLAQAPPPVTETPSTAPPDTPAPAPRLVVRALEDSPLLAPLPSDGPPPVAGILPVSARPEARVLLVAGDDGRPLLAFKNYGLGRVAAWTADLGGAWSAPWRTASAFPAWLAQWVSSLSPPANATVAADLLAVRQVEPRGPTPSEVAALERFCGQPLRHVSQARAPERAVTSVRVPIGSALALAAALALLLLAAIEFGLARRSVTTTSTTSA